MQNIFALRIGKLQEHCLRRWPHRGSRTPLLVAAISGAMLLGSGGAGAQPSTAAHKMMPQTQQQKARPRHQSTRKAARPPAQAVQTPPAAPAAPPAPQWPVNDPPAQASVVWNAQGLSIDAKNSSLQQILNEISSQTGVKIEGIGEDERVFGVYGPGDPREVLSDLLEGSGYNVLMLGMGQRGTPQQIVLSSRPQGGAQPNAPVSQGEMYQPPIAPYQPPEPIAHPNEPQRTPQQILQEMQQRQQLMREEQMRQQQQQQQDAPQQEQ